MSFEAVYDKRSTVLIVGTFPSPASFSAQFYYGHPQNRFWPLLSMLLKSELPCTIADKKALLLQNRIALWDVLESCSIKGAADATITNGVPNPLPELLSKTNISAVFANGAMAAKLYNTYWKNDITLPFFKLPSTSPANAAFSLPRLYEQWKIILDYILKMP